MFKKQLFYIDNADISERSRRMILRCYNSLATKSELSGVQVASYLMNWGDNYTNRSFNNIFLIGIERYLQYQLDNTMENVKSNFFNFKINEII